MITKEANDFLEKLMVTPRKPEFIGFTMDTEELYKKMVAKLNEEMEVDLSSCCSYDFAEDMEFLFYIDEYSIRSEFNEEEAERIMSSFSFDWDASWETAQYLTTKIFGVDTWGYAQGRYHDSHVCEIHIGLPRNL